MRNILAPIAVILLLNSPLAWGAPNPAEYTVNVHVVSSDVTNSLYGNSSGGSSVNTQFLSVVINGKKYELSGKQLKISLLRPGIIALGDYKAKLVTDEHKGTYLFAQEYEFLFPDQTTKKFDVIGESE